MVEEKKPIDDEYKDMSVVEPELEVVEEETGEGAKSLSEREKMSPNLSDMQAAQAILFPGDLGDRITNKLMIGRIAPDVFIPLLRLLVKDKILRTDPKKPISVFKAIAEGYTLLSIGLDGKGRIDDLELAGAAREEEELKKLGGGL